MKISRLISQLATALEEYGDIKVVHYNGEQLVEVDMIDLEFLDEDHGYQVEVM